MMTIKENVVPFHRTVAEYLLQGTDFQEYLQCFTVVNGYRNTISRIMFKKGGLKAYLQACRNPEHPLFIGSRAEASHCCTRLSAYLLDRMAKYNNEERAGRNPIPYGSKIWTQKRLGVYFTLGNQDLEAFFEKDPVSEGERLDGGDHAFDGGDH